MKRFLTFVLILIFLCSVNFSGDVQAQENPADPDGLIIEALENNPQLHAAREDLEAAKLRVPQSSALPDPTAGYSVMGPMLETPLGLQKDIYEFEQMIPFPGKLIEKRKMARADVAVYKAKVEQAEQDIALKVREIYYDLSALTATLTLAQEMYELLKKVEGVAQARYASQRGEQLEVVKAQMEVSETLKQILLLRQQKETLTAYLNVLLNPKQDKPLLTFSFPMLNFQSQKPTRVGNLTSLLGEGRSITDFKTPEIPELEMSLEQLIEKARQNRPELKEAVAMRDKALHAHALVKYENAMDVSVGFQYTRIGDGDTSDPDDGRDAWMVPIKVTLPIWQNRIGSAIEEAKRNQKAGEAMLKEEENRTDFEVKNAYYKFTAAEQIADLYQNALIPQAELAFNSGQAGYEAGKIDILSFIENEKVYLNSKSAYYQAIAEAMKSFVALERVVGSDLSGGGQ